MSVKYPIAASPAWVALHAQAAAQPRRPALSLRRHGAQISFSWSELAIRVHRAAAGWSMLGLAPGDTIVALGPLSESFVVSLLAVQALGAKVLPFSGDVPAYTLDKATHVLAHDGSDLARVLARRAQRASPESGEVPLGVHSTMKALVVEEMFGTERVEGILLQSWSALIDAASGDPARESASSAANRIQQSLQPSIRQGSGDAQSVLADFESEWTPGIDWLLRHWLAGGARLLLPEPDLLAGTELSKSRPQAWLASPGRLAAFDAQVKSRLPSGGPGARLAALAIQDDPGVWGALARWRLRQVLDLGSVSRLLTDAELDAPGMTLVRRLGVTVEQGLGRRLEGIPTPMTVALQPATKLIEGQCTISGARSVPWPQGTGNVTSAALRPMSATSAAGQPVVGLPQHGSGAIR